MEMRQRRRVLERHRIDNRKLRHVETPEAFNEYIDQCCEDLQAFKVDLSDVKKTRKRKPQQAELGMDREHVGGHVRDEEEAS